MTFRSNNRRRGPCATYDHAVCNCVCHVSDGVKHVAACCRQCPKCGQRIKVHAFETHTERCGESRLVA